MVPSRELFNLLIKRPTDWHSPCLRAHSCYLGPLHKGPALYLFHRPSGTGGGTSSPGGLATGRGGASTGKSWDLVCLLRWKPHSPPTSSRFKFKLQLRKRKVAGNGPKENSTEEKHSGICIFFGLFVNLSPLWPRLHYSPSLGSAERGFEFCSLITWVFIFTACSIKLWAQH